MEIVSPFNELFIQTAGNMQKPVDNQVYTDGQKGDGCRRQQRGKYTKGNCTCVFPYHAAPVGRRRLQAQTEKTQ